MRTADVILHLVVIGVMTDITLMARANTAALPRPAEAEAMVWIDPVDKMDGYTKNLIWITTINMYGVPWFHC